MGAVVGDELWHILRDHSCRAWGRTSSNEKTGDTRFRDPEAVRGLGNLERALNNSMTASTSNTRACHHNERTTRGVEGLKGFRFERHTKLVLLPVDGMGGVLEVVIRRGGPILSRTYR